LLGAHFCLTGERAFDFVAHLCDAAGRANKSVCPTLTLVFSIPVGVLKSISSSPSFQPDERQLEAIEHVHGPVLVVAGAGTGKTTVLTQRIARLIREGHARPEEILAVTYTVPAANEILGRVKSEIGGPASSKLQATTFHAYCNELLIRNGRKFGLLDEKDLWIYLRRRLHALHLHYFVRAANVGQFLNDLLGFISKCHDELVTPEKYAGYVSRLERGELPLPRIGSSKNPLPDAEVLERCREISSVFTTVERMLREENLGTFAHMITRALALLQEDAGLRAQEQRAARFILVDEFQDANFAQVKLLQTIAAGDHNVFAVGDPDQSVYRFRGASSAAFGLFQRSFPDAKLIVLGKNRRSTTAILNTAFTVINKNPNAAISAGGLQYRRAPLVSARDEGSAQTGEPVESVTLAERDLEPLDLVETLRERKRRAGTKWSDLAVLYRSHLHCEQVAAELTEQGIPFFIENMNVLDTTEVRDLLACAGVVVSSADAGSLFRVAAFPQWNIDPAKFRAMVRALPREGPADRMFSTLQKVEGGSEAAEAILAVRKRIEEAKSGAHAALCLIAEKFGINRSLPAIKAVLEFVKSWEGKPVTQTQVLSEFLEYLQYFRDAGGAVCVPPADEDAVRLTTVHAAKGLEWKHVFMIRAHSPSFPLGFRETLVEFPAALLDQDSVSEADNRELSSQEERRLFYVAMTRARDSLTLYAKAGAGKDKSPPGYVRDLIKDRSLTRWFRERKPRQFQTDMFAESQTEHAHARMTPWLGLPASADLGAKLSASAVQTYQTCPLQFKLSREWRIPSEIGAALQYGGAIHRVLKNYYDAVRYQREITEEDVIGQFKEALVGIQDRYQYDLYLAQGIRQLSDFMNNRRGKPQPEILHTEEWFEVRMGNIVLTGRIDRMDRGLDGRVIVTDYKTGKPRAQEDADDSLQLSIYALAVKEKWGYEVDRLVFHNIEEDAPVETYRDSRHIEEARHIVEDAARKIADECFTANPGFHCNFCSYRSLCPATEKRSFGTIVEKRTRTKT
jgi:DNA helicase-2/ATP-dependent DNA helicase PcrA